MLKDITETKNDNHLKKINKEIMYEELYRNYPEALFLLDCNGNFVDVNHGMELLVGDPKERIVNSHFFNYIYQNDLEHIYKYFHAALNGTTQVKELKLVDKMKKIKFVRMSIAPAYFQGELVGVYGGVKDISDKKNLENALWKNERRFESLIQNSSDVIGILDENGIVKYQSRAVSQVLGYLQQEIEGRSCLDFIFPADLEIVQTLLATVLKTPNITLSADFRLVKANGDWIYCEAKFKNLLNNESVNGIVVNYRDISARKKYEEETQRLVYHDHLTGLPNRNLLEKLPLYKINRAFTKNQKMAILYINLDRFKVINDSLGRSMGDCLLIKVAERLKTCISEMDILFRQCGDEFIILLSQSDREKALRISDLIKEELSIPFIINDYDLFISPSIGISLFPDDGKTVEKLIKYANSSMCKDGISGKSTKYIYSSKPSELNISPLKIEMDLYKAIENNELTLFYQPKLELKTGKLLGVEALLRWEHPELGWVSPASFIPIAEESGLIIPIGKWALLTACLQNKHWQDKGFAPISVSVNISAKQFFQPNLLEMIANVLDESGLDPRYLELEITESMTMDSKHTIKTLYGLKALGIGISIDDFGTGFSSLTYLKDFPVDTLKIDQSFIRDLHINPNGQTIVKTIISMAHNLNLSVVAEGIETTEQLQFLQEHSCNSGQGYYFSKPVPAEDLTKLLGSIENTFKYVFY